MHKEYDVAVFFILIFHAGKKNPTILMILDFRLVIISFCYKFKAMKYFMLKCDIL